MSLKKRPKWAGVILAIMLSAAIHGQGYHIDVEMKGLSEDTLILGEYFTTRMIPLDTILLDREGRGTFAGNESLVGGMYLVYIDPEHYFDILLGDDQHLGVVADTANLVGSLRFEGSEDNRIFLEYKNFLQEKRESSNNCRPCWPVPLKRRKSGSWKSRSRSTEKWKPIWTK